MKTTINGQNSTNLSEIAKTQFKNEIDIFAPLSTLKSNVPPNAFEISEEVLSLETWFLKIVKKVSLLRGIETPNEALTEIYNTLEERKFSINERNIAEIWLLKGDWTYKSPKRLTSDDFFPNPKKLEDFSEVLLYKGTIQELVNAIRLYAYNESSRNFERWVQAKEHELHINGLEKQFNDSQKDKLVIELLEYKAKNVDLQAKVKKLEENLAQVSTQNYERVARMQDIQQELNAKIAELELINQELEAKNEKLMIEATEYWTENA